MLTQHNLGLCMKIKHTLLSIVSLAAVTTVAFGATGTSASGTVDKLVIRTGDASDEGYFTLNGVTSISGVSCGTTGGLVRFRIKHDSSRDNIERAVTAAFLAGKSISVEVDSNNKDGAACYAESVRF